MMKRGNMKYLKTIVILILVVPLSLFAWKMESKTITLPATTTGSSTWHYEALQQTYDEAPLIFALTTSETNPFTPSEKPASLRVRNITTTGFDIVQVESMDNNTDAEASHPALTIHYIAIDRGVHYLPDGRMFVAGELNTTKVAEETDEYDEIFFPRAFRNTPVVLSMIQSLANEENTLPGQPTRPLLTTATKDVKTTNVELALERSKLREGDVTNEETIGYLAIEGGIQGTFIDADSNTVQYETIITPKNIQGWDEGGSDACKKYDYSNTYSTEPNLFGNKNTRRGGDGGWLRQCSNSATQAGVTNDEDIYDGSDRTHPVEEIAGLLAVSGDFKVEFEDTDRSPIAEYRMDECYWSGAEDEVKDRSTNGLDGTSYNNAHIETIDNVVNFAGSFDGVNDYMEVDDDLKLNMTDFITVSFWVYPGDEDNIYIMAGKTAGQDIDGWFIWFYNGDGGLIVSDMVVNGNQVQLLISKPSNWINNWHLITLTYDSSSGTKFTLKDADNDLSAADTTTGSITTSTNPMKIATYYSNDYYFSGRIDELKIWNVALNDTEINDVFTNESAEKNYDGTERSEVVCGASIAANTWEMISIPQESRSPTVLGVQDLFGDDFDGANYNAGDTNGWILWARDHNETNNGHTFHKVDYANNESIDFNKGYWLGSTVAEDWDVDETKAVDYNSSYNGTINCASARCVEVELEPVKIDGNRYNLINFPGKTPVDWADCRFIISDPDGSNVEILTAKSADAAGYASRTISVWPGGQGAGSGGQVQHEDASYMTCHDESAGGCELLPYHSAWIQVFTATLNKKIKLLIPEE